MTFAKPENTSYRGPKTPEVDVTRCPAYGCKLRATVSVGGSGFCCGVHAFAEPEDWQLITRRLSENDWLVEFIDELQAMEHKHQNWRDFAMQFWVNSDAFCQPHPQEPAILYQNRMRGELLFRCGQLAKRPQVRLPKNVVPRGQFAQRMAA